LKEQGNTLIEPLTVPKAKLIRRMLTVIHNGEKNAPTYRPT